MSTSPDSPAFLAAFERWRVAVTGLAVPRAVSCEEQQKWEQGKIMQVASDGSVDVMSDAARKQEAKDCKQCNRWRDELVRESPIVRFMLQHTALLPPPPAAPDPALSGQPHLPLPITCRPCPPTMAGGYSPALGILLCQNRFMSRKHMEDALSHELVHAWDGRRFEVQGEWGADLRAHACTEVRRQLHRSRLTCAR